jgi:hypothetical protein
MPQNGYTHLMTSDKCPIMTNEVAMSAIIAKKQPGRWMPSKDWPGLHGHASGGVEIRPQTDGVFCFPGGRIVLTERAVKEIAALSEAAKAASEEFCGADRRGSA